MVLTKKHIEWWDTFIPRSLSGLTLWLDNPAISSNIIEDGSNRVSQWNDISGNNNHFIQTTGADQPLRSGSDITFDGATEFLQSDDNVSNFNDNVGELFIIGNNEDISQNGRLIGIGNTSIADDFWHPLIWVNGASGGRSQTFGGAFLDNSAAQDNNIYSLTALGTSVALMNLSSNGSAYKIEINGVDEVVGIQSGADNGQWIDVLTSRDSFRLGSLQTNGEFFGNVSIRTIVYYNRQLTAAERLQVTNYLNNRFGL